MKRYSRKVYFRTVVKNGAFNKKCWENWLLYSKKKKKLLLILYTKINSRKTGMLKVKAYNFKKNLLENISMTALEGVGIG